MLKIYITFILFLLFPVVAFAQPEPFPFDVRGADGALGSVYIEDFRTGDVLMDVNGDVPMIPASVTKLLTAATVLDNHPKDFRYHTRVFTTGSVSDSVLHGNIIINAIGDPTLESSYFTDNNGFISDVVNALRSRGIVEIEGKVLTEYDDRLEEEVPSGWMESDLAWGYGTGFHAANFKDNCFVLSLPSKSSSPHVPGLEVKHNPSKGNLDYYRKRGSKAFRVSGRIPKNGAKEKLANPAPAQSLSYEIEKALHSSGIEVDGDDIRSRQPRLLLTHLSPALIDILRSTLYRSDNLMAEGMFKLAWIGESRSQIAGKELDLWRARNIDCEGIKIFDGSGLSRDNRISAYFLADMLAWKGYEHLDMDYVSLLPKCGVNGTVRNLLKGTRLQGRVALKSGSMRGVRCYAGYALDESV